MENLHPIVTKQPRSARQSGPVCYKRNKKGNYASQSCSRQEHTCYRCKKKGHYASECPMKPNLLVSCTYCHRKGHRAEDCFERKGNEAADKQDIRILRTKSVDDSSNNHLMKADNVMFVEQEADETRAAFKRSATSKTLTKQERMQNDIAEYGKPVVRTDPQAKSEPDLPAPRKTGQGARNPHKSQMEKHLSEH